MACKHCNSVDVLCILKATSSEHEVVGAQGYLLADFLDFEHAFELINSIVRSFAEKLTVEFAEVIWLLIKI